MADWERTAKYMAIWTGFIKPYIEDEIGPMPEYKFFRPFFKKKLQRITNVLLMDAPFRYCKKDKPGLILYDRMFDSWFYNHLGADSLEEKEFGLGRLVFSLVHDLFHIPQFESLLRGNSDYIGKYFTHLKWVEGLAQLYTFKICSRMCKDAQEENFSWFGSPKVEDFITHALEHRKYKRSLTKEIARMLFRDTERLRERGFIDRNKISFSDYPFELDAESKKIFLDYLFLRYKDNHRRAWWRTKPYIVGAYLLSKLISNNTYSLEELLKKPLSDRELRKKFS